MTSVKVWDYELEYLAHIHAGRCKQDHDKCRNTFRIVDSGQNLAHKITRHQRAPTPIERSRGSSRQWFAESENVTLEFLARYPNKRQLPDLKPGVKM